MDIFADTADIEEIKKLNDLGIIDGVTTNPTLIAKSGRDLREVLGEICDVVRDRYQVKPFLLMQRG